MRVDPDFAPPAPQPPREAHGPRQAPEPVRPPGARPGRAQTPEKDSADYDDWAWM